MTTATITEVSVEDFPCELKSGTGLRRARVIFRSSGTAGGSTVDFSSYIPGMADIEGRIYETDDNASTSTGSTWSTTTLTVGAGIGAYESCHSITFT